MKLGFYFFAGFFLCFAQSSLAQGKTILVPKSTISPVINGIIEPAEWNDAQTFYFEKKDVLKTKVHIKHDGKYLYIVFENLLESNAIRLNPEILIDTNPSNNQWTGSCFWFHSSHSNCFSAGEYYFWKDCNENSEGWNANTFPFVNNNNNIEFKISFTKLGLTPTTKKLLKIAFKISNPNDQHFYWPTTASIENPASWYEIKI